MTAGNTVASDVPGTTPRCTTTVTPKKATGGLNKDSVAVPDHGPILNK